MKKMHYSGATAPFDAEPGDEDRSINLRRLSRSALVDRVRLDPDDAVVMLGPIARKFHGLPANDERIGIRTFLECYDPDARNGLVELIERLAGEGQSFHFTARLATPASSIVHGFLAAAEPGEKGVRWTGMLVMSRQEAAMPVLEAVN